MKIKDVPQDPGLDIQNKLIWAVDDNGKFVTVKSLGWNVPETSFRMYYAYVGQTLKEARERIARGERSPLYYWMRFHQLSESTLADYVGMWKWRVKRHLKPQGFAKLSPKILARYADALQTPLEQLTCVPDKDPESIPRIEPDQV
jgi:hypothetical protein